MATKGRVIIAGATGVVGRAATELMAAKGWDVVALARRKPENPAPAQYVSVDLRDAAQCHEAIASLGAFTHIVYTALFEKAEIVKGWGDNEQVQTNLAMLTNLVEAVEKTSPDLRHINLLQGAKAYGVHLGVNRNMPTKEAHGRFMPPNFYYNQEDWLRERQAGASWTWTALRPPAVCSAGVGTALNIALAVGVFAAISRELGIPMRYPGGDASIFEVCDARLVARAIEWAATSENAQNEIFNLANGDHFQWPLIWPLFAELFDMPAGQPHTFSLAQVMADKEPVWNRIVEKHGLRPFSYKEVAPAWDFADFCFRLGRPSNPTLMSTIKIRQAGFHDCMDSEQMFTSLIREMQDDRILPR